MLLQIILHLNKMQACLKVCIFDLCARQRAVCSAQDVITLDVAAIEMIQDFVGGTRDISLPFYAVSVIQCYITWFEASY